MTRLFEARVPSPVGALRLVADDVALVGVYFPAHRNAPSIEAREAPEHAVLDQAAREIEAYFRGDLRAFTTPLAPRGTDFQRAVWAALASIPFGQRRSYTELAAAVDRPRAVRAVGTANAQNPLSIFVPCHRVVAADGTLAGYAGGLAAKAWLLAHERPSRLDEGGQ